MSSFHSLFLYFDIKDAFRSGRLTKNVDEIMQKAVQDRPISSHYMSDELNVHHQIVLNRMEKTEFKKKLVVSS